MTPDPDRIRLDLSDAAAGTSECPAQAASVAPWAPPEPGAGL